MKNKAVKTTKIRNEKENVIGKNELINRAFHIQVICMKTQLNINFWEEYK